MKIKIINDSENPLPAYETKGSAGMDLRAFLKEPVMLKPLQRVLIPTGLSIELPKGYEAQVRPRSGLAIKKGLSLINTPGTIDCDYRGELMVLLINLGDAPFEVTRGMRIAQLVIAPVSQLSPTESSELPEPTKRGKGGFGSTGLG